MATVVVVGASLAGAQAAQVLRREGFDGRLIVVGDESHYPYDRPPLSKEYLTAEEPDEDRLRLRATADPEALDIDWRLGQRATGLNLAGRVISTAHGESIGFDGLVLACGASPRRLPGQPPPPEPKTHPPERPSQRQGIHELRTLDDARRLRQALMDGARHVVVCGAGFIGAEVAASARQRGLAVTLIDAAPTPLDRVLDRPAGEAVADLHRANGVDVRLGVRVTGFEPTAEGGWSVELGHEIELTADVVVVGVGVVPNTAWLEGSGLQLDDGIVTDETTSVAPGVVAAGDVARWPNRRFGGRLMRVEQWDNAIDMGAHAARRLLADLAEPGSVTSGQPFQPVPWFWSDQYDRKIQLAGLVGPVAEVVQGSMDEGRFVQIYGDDDGQLTGALCWNRPRQAIQARQLVAEGASLDAARDRLS